MKELLYCWVFGHSWVELRRRTTQGPDELDHQCFCCREELTGAEGMLQLPTRPTVAQVWRQVRA